MRSDLSTRDANKGYARQDEKPPSRGTSFLTERNGQQNQTLENRLRANFGIAKGVQAIPTGRYDSGGCLADTRTHRYESDGPSAPALVTEKSVYTGVGGGDGSDGGGGGGGGGGAGRAGLVNRSRNARR